MHRQAKAYCFALGAVACWSTVATAFKLTLRHSDVLQLLFVATTTAASVLLAMCLWLGKLPLLRSLECRRIVKAAVLGLLNPFAYYLVLFGAYDRLPAQIAQAVNYTWTIALALLSVPLLAHRLGRADVVAVVFGYSGAAIICLGGSRIEAVSLSAVGIALALASTLIWALYWIAKAADTVDPVVGLTVSFLFAVPVAALACVLLSDLAGITAGGLAGGVYVGIFEMGVPFVLWLLALQHTRAAVKITTLVYLAPFLSLLLIRRLLGEPIVASTVFGLTLIVLGLLIQQRGGHSLGA